MRPTIGFIGFGEVGSSMAQGFAAQDLVTRAYDIKIDVPDECDALRKRGSASSTTICDSPSELPQPCDVIFSAVVTSNTLDAGMAVVPSLREGQLLVDCNSVAPAVKRQLQKAVEGRGARYVDAGVMAAVPNPKHAVRMLLAGEAAVDLCTMMEPWGMNLEVLSRNVGDAAATKLFQSILIKGTEALLLECLMAATQEGVERHVLDSMSLITPGLDWMARANYMLSRTAKHGARRAAEMDEAVRTLQDMDIDPMVSRGIAERLHWAAKRTQPKAKVTDMPGFREVIAVIRSADEA